MALIFLIIFGALAPFSKAEVLHTTKFFTIKLEPSFFNWTFENGDEVLYHASLLKAPDLPNWMQYLYSDRYKMGYLYGVPPAEIKDLEVELVGMNRNTYETRRRVIHLTIQSKTSPATQHVHMKIDNLNVEDLFEPKRLSRLMAIFQDKLWPDSFADLYVTFLSSAVAQGARLPLKPNESEGVVMRIGSTAPFSDKLIALHDEVKPLLKNHPCRRDFKRTTVERWFRDEGFHLDWCSFKLVSEAPASSDTRNESPNADDITRRQLKIYREQLPQRSYAGEFAVTILVPMILMVLLVVMLSIILCFQHEGIDKESDEFFNSLFVPCEDFVRSRRKVDESEEEVTHYVAVQRATSTLRSLSRDTTPAVSYSAPNCDDVSRPNPPPYMGTLRSTKSDF